MHQVIIIGTSPLAIVESIYLRKKGKSILNIDDKKVPGGLKTGEKYFQTEAFKIELANFKKNYLCGICRDKNKIKNKQTRNQI